DTLEEAQLRVTVRADSLALIDPVSPRDRQEIENRMRAEVLDTAAYPEITFQSLGTSAAQSAGEHRYHVRIRGQLSLHGATQVADVEAHLALFDDGFRLSGVFPLRLSDYRIRPVTALGGTIKLKDQVQ